MFEAKSGQFGRRLVGIAGAIGVAAGALAGSVAWACMTHGTKSDAKNLPKAFLAKVRKPAQSRIVPFGDGHRAPTEEAHLGNLMIARGEPDRPGTVVLSIPARILRSTFHPFGDGQSNAKLDFGPDWRDSEFPAYGVERRERGGRRIRRYHFHPRLRVSAYDEIPLGEGWYEVKPRGWQDSFYFSFESGMLPAEEFIRGIPERFRTFRGNRTAPDPARVGGPGVFDRLRSQDLGPGYNTQPWFSDNVHGRFPDAQGRQTALGGVATWGIVDPQFGPFKHLYTCFEPRNLSGERASGIPSGAGWHHIGDAAETLLNTLEDAAIPAAVARSHSRPRAAYGLGEAITAVWVPRGSALVTRRGEFHWYLNPVEQTVCTEVWVHPCVPSPSNHWGFDCR